MKRHTLPEQVKNDIADKGYHSNQVLKDCQEAGIKSYISEPERGRRSWTNKGDEQRATYGNRRRIRSDHGKALLRQRAEFVERSFAHIYDTGGMRRCWLRGAKNIMKRLLVHVAAFNLGLLLRKLTGYGTPRGLAGRNLSLSAAVMLALWSILTFWSSIFALIFLKSGSSRISRFRSA